MTKSGGTDRQDPREERPEQSSYWVDDFTLALLKQGRDATTAWGEFLAGFRWQVYVVLTFASRPSYPGAQRAVQTWLDVLQQSFPRLNAYVSYDLGKATARLNVHVFLGGLFPRKSAPQGFHRAIVVQRAIVLAKRTWTRGQVPKIEPYDARRGAPDYLARYANQSDLIGDFFGRPIKKKKRRKRARQTVNDRRMEEREIGAREK